MKKTIVKVQIPLMSNAEDGGQALIYDKTRSWQTFAPVTETLMKNMKGEPKKFFYARVTKDEVSLDEEAPWQHW